VSIKAAAIAVLAMIYSPSLNAQDEHEYLKLNTNLGMGVSVPLNPTARLAGASANAVAGAGYNFDKHHSIIGQFMWSGLPPNKATELRRIGDLIASPPFIVVRDTGEATSGDERRRLRVIPTQPAGLLIASASAGLSENSWAFVAGRALETLRSGLRTSVACWRPSSTRPPPRRHPRSRGL
jgi:hypothetical protein